VAGPSSGKGAGAGAKLDLTISGLCSLDCSFCFLDVLDRKAAMPVGCEVPVSALEVLAFTLTLLTLPSDFASALKTSMKLETFFSLRGTDLRARLPPEPRRFSIKAFR